MSARYLKTLDRLFQRKASSTKMNAPYKLDAVREAAKRFNEPFNNYRIIHVAGTNGKGSVCTKLSTVLSSCGYKTGLTLSPHISTVRERIQINNQMISEHDFCEQIDEILQMEAVHGNELSFFELMTLASFHFFAEQQVDYAVIEVGLGGLLDATNIIQHPLLSVIATISLDHTRILGQTEEEITRHKVVIGPTVNQDIIGEFVQNRHLLHRATYENDTNWHDFDQENICIAKKCINVLSEMDTELNRLIAGKTEAELNQALLAKPKCRFEVVKCDERTDCVLDAAHNEAGMRQLVQLLLKHYPVDEYNYRIVIGLSGDSKLQCLQLIQEYATYIHFVSISDINHRSLTIETLQQYYAEEISKGLAQSKVIGTPQHLKSTDCAQIMQYALNECTRHNEKRGKQEKKEVLIVCGSLYIMSNARQVLGFNEFVDPVDFSNIEFGKRAI